MVVVVFFCYNFSITCYHQLLVFAFNCEKYRCMGYFVSVFDVGYDKVVSLLFQGMKLQFTAVETIVSS